MHTFLHMIFSHFAAMLVAMCFKKCSASLWRSPSTDVTKGVNVPRLSSTAFLYSFFFSRAPVSKIDSGVRCRCDGGSMSMTFYQTMLPPGESKHLECLD